MHKPRTSMWPPSAPPEAPHGLSWRQRSGPTLLAAGSANTQETSKIPVSQRALLARINCELAKKGEKMRRCPQGSRWFRDLGPFFVLNVRRNIITAKDCDLATWGRDLGCLEPYEELSA